MKKTLKQLFLEHQGKVSDKWSLYLDEWDRFFKPYRDQSINLLEIGIQNGGSLEIWSRYFPKAGKLVGCDIDKKCELLRYDDARIAVIVGDVNLDECESEILQQAPMFDIIIDDGSHVSSDIVRSFARYFPHLNDGGIYLVEDLHASYWKNTEGGLHNPLSAMAFFKRLSDIPNFEHWMNNKSRVSLLAKFEAAFGIKFDEFDLTRIHSIELLNSLCIIRKSSPDKNVLGKRILVGTAEGVTTGMMKLNGTLLQDSEMHKEQDDGNLDVFELITQNKEKEQAVQVLTAYFKELTSSTAWSIIQLLWRGRLFLAPHGSRREKFGLPMLRPLRRFIARLTRTGYDKWIAMNEPSRTDLLAQRVNVKAFKHKPLISVIVPVWNTPANILDQTIQSVVDQTYGKWELCIADGNSTPETKKVLSDWAKKDHRIRIKFLAENNGIALNSNEALSLARGKFVTFLDHDDCLSPFALFEVVKALQQYPGADLIYSDEDSIMLDGKDRSGPHFKPAFSPDLLRSVNYITHLVVVRKTLGDKIGWLRNGYEGAQDYDFVLRASEQAIEVLHIPKVLYHWRRWSSSTTNTPGVVSTTAKSYANEAGKKALQEHLERCGLNGVVENGPDTTTYQVKYNITDQPLVSIIILNRDHSEDLSKCIRSIRNKSTYKKYEIIIVENASQEVETFRLYKEYEKDPSIRIIEYKEPFNFSRANNFAVGHALGDVILFLNNDIEVISSDWLERMVEHALRKEVGIVGSKLYYPDHSIQHAGIILGIGGFAGHSHKHFLGESKGYINRLRLIQNYSGVTGACLMMRKAVFYELEGFDEQYALALSDIDLCLKALSKDYLIVWTPYAELYHHESKTRGYEDNEIKQKRFKGEIERFKHKWSTELARGDEYYNPNLTLSAEDFSIDLKKIQGAVRMKPGFMLDGDKHQ